jgi:cell division protein FtsI (penicillin-binding protein 3)
VREPDEGQGRPRGPRSVRRPAGGDRRGPGPGARGGPDRRSPDRRSTTGRHPPPGGQPPPGQQHPGRRPGDQAGPSSRRGSQRREIVLPAGRGKPGRPERGRGRRPAPPRRPPRTRRRKPVNRSDPGRRLRIGLLCIAFVLSLFAGRLVQMQGLDGGHYRMLAERQRVQTMQMPAVRGSITTADGTVLASTVQTDVVFADPKLMTAAQQPQIAAALAGPLGMSQAQLLALIQHPTSPEYVKLKAGVPAQTGQRISGLRLPGGGTAGQHGIGLTPSYSRSYPNGELAAPLVGFTDTDSAGNLKGEAGIESADNSLLAGRDGTQEVQTSATGQAIPLSPVTLTPTVPGRNVRLTILTPLQYAAEQACKQKVIETHAKYCTVVIMQPHTGQILAMAQYPGFNPASPASLRSTTNDAVTDVFNPGSTAKVITIAAALERGHQTMMSPYRVPYSITENGFPFHDAEYHPTEHLTIAGILANSSNVGMVQVAQHISKQTQYHYYRAFGIGEPTGINLPGQSDGLLLKPSQYYGDTKDEMAFGQGVAANALQMASVYATIANNGVRVQPSIVAGATNGHGQYVPAPAPPKRRVIKASTAHDLIPALEQVPVVDAEAGVPWAEIAGYQIAAKTGTAQEPNAKGCLCDYGASLIGMAPASNPQVVVAVNIQDPKGSSYFGIQVAGPVFYQTMRATLQTLKIPPNYAKLPHVRLTAP